MDPAINRESVDILRIIKESKTIMRNHEAISDRISFIQNGYWRMRLFLVLGDKMYGEISFGGWADRYDDEAFNGSLTYVRKALDESYNDRVYGFFSGVSLISYYLCRSRLHILHGHLMNKIKRYHAANMEFQQARDDIYSMMNVILDDYLGTEKMSNHFQEDHKSAYSRKCRIILRSAERLMADVDGGLLDCIQGLLDEPIDDSSKSMMVHMMHKQLDERINFLKGFNPSIPCADTLLKSFERACSIKESYSENGIEFFEDNDSMAQNIRRIEKELKELENNGDSKDRIELLKKSLDNNKKERENIYGYLKPDTYDCWCRKKDLVLNYADPVSRFVKPRGFRDNIEFSSNADIMWLGMLYSDIFHTYAHARYLLFLFEVSKDLVGDVRSPDPIFDEFKSKIRDSYTPVPTTDIRFEYLGKTNSELSLSEGYIEYNSTYFHARGPFELLIDAFIRFYFILDKIANVVKIEHSVRPVDKDGNNIGASIISVGRTIGSNTQENPFLIPLYLLMKDIKSDFLDEESTPYHPMLPWAQTLYNIRNHIVHSEFYLSDNRLLLNEDKREGSIWRDDFYQRTLMLSKIVKEAIMTTMMAGLYEIQGVTTKSLIKSVKSQKTSNINVWKTEDVGVQTVEQILVYKFDGVPYESYVKELVWLPKDQLESMENQHGQYRSRIFYLDNVCFKCIFEYNSGFTDIRDCKTNVYIDVGIVYIYGYDDNKFIHSRSLTEYEIKWIENHLSVEYNNIIIKDVSKSPVSVQNKYDC